MTCAISLLQFLRGSGGQRWIRANKTPSQAEVSVMTAMSIPLSERTVPYVCYSPGKKLAILQCTEVLTHSIGDIARKCTFCQPVA